MPQGIGKVKPRFAVVWVQPQGQPKVADFGMARVMQNTDGAGGGLTLSTTLLGSPPYMAPEQATGENVDHRADPE